MKQNELSAQTEKAINLIKTIMPNDTFIINVMILNNDKIRNSTVILGSRMDILEMLSDFNREVITSIAKS